MNRLVLMPVDPYLLYAYWDLASGSPPATDARTVLRLYESPIDIAPSRPFDIDIDLAAGNSYIHTWSPARNFYAELGLRRQDGALLVLARSNGVRTAPACPPATHAAEPITTSSVPENFSATLEPIEDTREPEPLPHHFAAVPAADLTRHSEDHFTFGLSSYDGGTHGA